MGVICDSFCIATKCTLSGSPTLCDAVATHFLIVEIVNFLFTERAE